jgi:adenosylcobinamide kinase/adenosylcobinamide-phosphate guanylyltransferase
VITLVLGGARSGKSALAERLAARTLAPVTYVATLHVAGDIDLAERVATHRLQRPREWAIVECGGDLVGVLNAAADTVLVDSLGPWLAALPEMNLDVEGLCVALTSRAGDTIIVSDEVGLGVHPESAVGRQFRDALGVLNQAVARIADEVLLVVAGRALRLGSGESE